MTSEHRTHGLAALGHVVDVQETQGRRCHAGARTFHGTVSETSPGSLGRLLSHRACPALDDRTAPSHAQ